MKLVSLQLRQWRSFEQCDLEFPDGLIGVRGPNGAGKTTIAEAIGWALFGKLRAGAKVGDLRRQGIGSRERSLVILTFRLGETLYTVERVVNGSAKLWIGDGEQPETSQTRATNARIVQELDLTWETFQRTVFARQKDVAALDPSGSGEARKRHVERLLGLERYRAAAEKARARAKELDQQLTGLREQAPDLDEARAELVTAEREAAAADPAVTAAKQLRAEAAERVTDAEAAVERERSRAERHERLVADAQRLARELGEVEEELADRRERLERRLEQERRLAALDGHDADLDALALARRHLEDLATCAAELAELERQSGPEFDVDAAAARASELAEVQRDMEAVMEQRDPDVTGLGERVAALEALDLATPVEVARAELEHLDAERDEARARRATIRARILEDEAHLAAVEKGGADVECPTCLRPYGEDFERIVAAHRQHLTIAHATFDEVDARCAELDAQLPAYEQALRFAEMAALQVKRTTGPEKLDDARAALAAAEQQCAARQERLTALRAQRAEMAEHVTADRREGEEAAEARARLAAGRERFAAVADAAGVTTYDPEAKAAAVAAHELALHVRSEREQLTAALDASAGVDADVERLASRRDDRATRAEAVRTELDELSVDPEFLRRLKDACTAARAAYEEAGEAVHAAEAASLERDHRVGELRRRLADAEAAHAVLIDRALEARRYAVAGDVLGEYRTAQHRRAWPRLETGASALLSETTDGRYADVRLSDDYKLVIVDRGEQHGLDRYSGGEQDLANLCLRLAIADWVSRERGVEMGFVILDEVFGSQDDERRQRLITELRSLSNRFHQLLVITHLPDIAELCEHQVQVELVEDGKSRAYVTT